MSTARSVFTEAIEDHLALKKQNVALDVSMPLARYDVGDPLDRYPGGPNRAADGSTVIVADVDAETAFADDALLGADATQFLVGPSPEQAMEAATALEPTFADRPFEPLNGLAPMLSLVEDIDDADEAAALSAPVADAPVSADVLRFPGGVGPREDAHQDVAAVAADQTAFDVDGNADGDVQMHGFAMPTGQFPAVDAEVSSDAPTGEQPVLVIDADEPLASDDWSTPSTSTSRNGSKRPRFFGLGRKSKRGETPADGWFTEGARDFNWD